MVVSRDHQEISVLECILGSLHMNVQVESEPQRAWDTLSKSKIDALIVDSDLEGTEDLLGGLHGSAVNSVPLVILSGQRGKRHEHAQGAPFRFEKPISVEQAVRTLSAARNVILDGRLHYHRQALDIPVSLSCRGQRLKARLVNLSEGGIGIWRTQPIPASGPVQVSFSVPSKKQPFRLRGEFAWKDDQGKAGIRFVGLTPEMRRNLRLWLAQQYFTH
jgi:hypothetical protein